LDSFWKKNSKNCIDVGLGLDRDDQLYGNKKKLLHENFLSDGQTYCITDVSIPEKLIFALRVYHMSIYDADEIKQAFENKPISSQNEKKVVRTLLDLCEHSIKGYPTTAKVDKERLSDLKKKEPNLTKAEERLEKALIFRIGEKRILHKTLQKVQEMMEEVKKGWNLRSIDTPGTDGFKAAINGQEIL